MGCAECHCHSCQMTFWASFGKRTTQWFVRFPLVIKHGWKITNEASIEMSPSNLYWSHYYSHEIPRKYSDHVRSLCLLGVSHGHPTETVCTVGPGFRVGQSKLELLAVISPDQSILNGCRLHHLQNVVEDIHGICIYIYDIWQIIVYEDHLLDLQHHIEDAAF